MAVLLNKSDMAASLGISTQAFDKWSVKPVERRGREVLFDVKSVLDNRIEHLARKQQPEEQDFNLDYERWRLTKEQADKAALENEKKRSEVVETQFCTFVLSKLSAEIASLLDGIPLSIQRRFPELENRHIEFLKVDIIKAMNKASALDDILPELLNEYIAQSDN